MPISTICFKARRSRRSSWTGAWLFVHLRPAVSKLLPGDQGRPLTDLSSRLDYPDLESDIRTVFGGEAIERALSLSEGTEHYLARLLPYRISSDIIDGVLLTFVDVTSIIAA